MSSLPCKLRPFLTAEWRHLAMFNYPVDPGLLEPHVPPGTTLDTYQGKVYVSIVGFLFLNTRVFGVRVPFHVDFEEINLRFYVRRFADGDWRRGVVFIKEIVPRQAIAGIARWLYNERYVALPMSHEVAVQEAGIKVEYRWQHASKWQVMKASGNGKSITVQPGSLEEFITEHYWGYVLQKNGSALEYKVDHPRWNIWRAENAALDCDIATVYGAQFAPFLIEPPTSAFIADGSAVTVYRGAKL
ncbi:MAG TPA: DUF2071 domain-containing protein [Candidatus Saccharimonadales bacterium]|nr:DUF2071 domain-containing protein [Candidatus Saccharimonadales bacterium]